VGAAGYLLGFDDIGLTGGSPRIALIAAVTTALLASFAGTLILRRQEWCSSLVDLRVADLSRPEAGFHILVRIPIFTALVEEAFFRGVLYAVLMALYPGSVAFGAGAVLFGLWHVAPALDQARANGSHRARMVVHVAETVVATTIAGAVLIWLREQTGSIWAPFAVHAALNMTAAVYSRLAAQPRPGLVGVEA
jgi:membrane protease YdiL (CAAX protease family)